MAESRQREVLPGRRTMSWESIGEFVDAGVGEISSALASPPPSACLTKRLRSPWREEEKAGRLPSGDQTGEISLPSCVVIRVLIGRSTSWTHMSGFSSCTQFTTAMRLPSGESENTTDDSKGSPMVPTGFPWRSNQVSG